MIAAQELRIGNYLESYGREIIISGHYLSNVQRGAPIDNPIPITEEWLLNFGFFYTHSYYIIELTDNRHDKKDFFTVRVQGDKYEAILRNWDLAKLFLLTEIKYVHQLQNLYFAITQTELEIK